MKNNRLGNLYLLAAIKTLILRKWKEECTKSLIQEKREKYDVMIDRYKSYPHQLIYTC